MVTAVRASNDKGSIGSPPNFGSLYAVGRRGLRLVVMSFDLVGGRHQKAEMNAQEAATVERQRRLVAPHPIPRPDG
ncbi:hypothetical protein MIC448_500004 [Microbacterium sp. C448]|nr:hypothetical protein MIC448_500004 [Microbacterium sp. C448]